MLSSSKASHVNSQKAIGLLSLLISVMFGAVALGCTASGPASASEFARMLREVHYDYEPVESPQALMAMADLVVLGTIDDVTPGRTLHGIGKHATLTVRVERVVSGDVAPAADGRVFVEVTLSGRVTVPEMRAAANGSRVVLFLDDRSHLEDPVSPGRPSDAPIFAPYAQGVIMDDGEGIIGGFEDLQKMGPEWAGAQTLDDFVNRLTSSSADGETVTSVDP